ncbi:uncharacterized protein DEA37_0006416 [Paragonimus westermani]|uniref:Thioredoxin domain-containing protein n=1 Tax=Paragonimus westermani TaxID=34504 RepID=A0A5J4NAK7_9TREM|nr:uncharacterized protein DEA37_0006416 [Paragonimus westermani]
MMLVMVAYDLITSWVIEQRHVFNIRLPVYPSVQLTVLLIFQTIAADYGVRSLPTFVFVRGNKVIDRLLGAQVELLKNKLREHAKQEGADSTSQSSGQGSKQVCRLV